MKLDLTPEQAFFHGTTRQFLDDKVPTSLLRELRSDPAGFDRDFWRQGADLGWTSLLVTEADGGGSVSGQGLVDLALVAFEFGRLRRARAADHGERRRRRRGPVRNRGAEGRAAARPDDRRPDRQLGVRRAASVRASWARSACGLGRTAGGTCSRGTKAPVEAAGQADLFLVTAVLATEGDDAGGLIQFLVPAGTPGVSVRPMGTLDITRRYGRVAFDDAAVPASAVLGEPGLVAGNTAAGNTAAGNRATPWRARATPWRATPWRATSNGSCRSPWSSSWPS